MIPILVKAVLLPALAAGVVYAALLALTGKSGAAPVWSAALAAGAGALVTALGIAGWNWPDFPPTEATRWLLYVALAGVAFGMLEAWKGLPPATRWLGRAALVLLVITVTMKAMVQYHWEGIATFAWPVGAGIVLLAVWSALDGGEETSGSTLRFFQLAALAGSGGIVLALSESLRLGQLAGGIAAGFAGLWLVSLVMKPERAVRGSLAVFVPVLGLLWLSGHFFAGLELIDAGLMVLAPLLLMIGRAEWVQDLSGKLPGTVETVVFLLPLTAAVVRVMVYNLPGLLAT